jgi:DNA repair protein RadC
MELVRRKKFSTKQKVKITSSKLIYEEMYPFLADKKYEEFWVVYLNRNNMVIDKKQISSGGVSATVVDPKIIFKYALENLASGIILVHNHPSGNIQASSQDIQLTKKIKDAANVFDIKVLDHLIFAGEQYYSFADNGAL